MGNNLSQEKKILQMLPATPYEIAVKLFGKDLADRKLNQVYVMIRYLRFRYPIKSREVSKYRIKGDRSKVEYFLEGQDGS